MMQCSSKINWFYCRRFISFTFIFRPLSPINVQHMHYSNDHSSFLLFFCFSVKMRTITNATWEIYTFWMEYVMLKLHRNKPDKCNWKSIKLNAVMRNAVIACSSGLIKLRTFGYTLQCPYRIVLLISKRRLEFVFRYKLICLCWIG